MQDFDVRTGPGIRPRLIARLLAVAVVVAALDPGSLRTATAADAPAGTGASQDVPVRTRLPTGCDAPRPPRPSPRGPTSVLVNPATAWQPRGGEILVEVRGEAANIAALGYRACFAWQEKSEAEAGAVRTEWHEGAVTVRPSSTSGLVHLGVEVPMLPDAPHGLWTRLTGEAASKGLGIVPLARMRLIGMADDGVRTDETRSFGVTSVKWALLNAVCVLGLAIMILHAMSGTPATPVGGKWYTKISAWWDRRWEGLKRMNWLLDLVRTPDGRASLSGFQILLWSATILVSAMFVMSLSGNLINMTEGTLILLGIAGLSGMAAAVAEGARTRTAVTFGPPRPAELPAQAAWRDLLVDPVSDLPDVARIQMLLFTVVGAVFVLLQVLSYRIVPDIPSGYLYLLGISNGVYVGRKVTG